MNSSRRKFRKFEINDVRERLHFVGGAVETIDLTEANTSSCTPSVLPRSPKKPSPLKRTPLKTQNIFKKGNQTILFTNSPKRKSSKMTKNNNSVICLDSESEDSFKDAVESHAQPVSQNNSSKDLSVQFFKDLIKNRAATTSSSSATQSTGHANCFFYEDKSTKFKHTGVPKYTMTVDTLVSNSPLRAANDVDLFVDNSTPNKNDDSVVFLNEIPGTSDWSKNFIALPSKTSNANTSTPVSAKRRKSLKKNLRRLQKNLL